MLANYVLNRPIGRFISKVILARQRTTSLKQPSWKPEFDDGNYLFKELLNLQKLRLFARQLHK